MTSWVMSKEAHGSGGPPHPATHGMSSTGCIETTSIRTTSLHAPQLGSDVEVWLALRIRDVHVCMSQSDQTTISLARLMANSGVAGATTLAQ